MPAAGFPIRGLAYAACIEIGHAVQHRDALHCMRHECLAALEEEALHGLDHLAVGPSISDREQVLAVFHGEGVHNRTGVEFVQRVVLDDVVGGLVAFPRADMDGREGGNVQVIACEGVHAAISLGPFSGNRMAATGA